MSRTQLDMFAEQDDLFPTEPIVYRADPDRIRRRLGRILAEARAADTMPWDRSRLELYRTIFQQMALSLPEDEAAQLRLEFDREIERLA
ncbi:hypothetical protein [Microbaculum marinum]|uniref:Uncharacterized protein n=1 Tax=Microbaculum marinum TaxID=1764581 RepID=A0AAW9RX93_9HYPH